MASEFEENNNNYEVYPYPGKAKSVVWKFFGLLKKAEGPPTKANLDMATAVCRVCGKKYANKGRTHSFSLEFWFLHELYFTTCQ